MSNFVILITKQKWYNTCFQSETTLEWTRTKNEKKRSKAKKNMTWLQFYVIACVEIEWKKQQQKKERDINRMCRFSGGNKNKKQRRFCVANVLAHQSQLLVLASLKSPCISYKNTHSNCRAVCTGTKFINCTV